MATNEFDVGDVETDFVSFEHDGLEGWDGEFKLPTAGEYLFEVDKAENKAASTGSTYLNVAMRIISLANGNGTTEEGKMVFGKYFPNGKDKARARLVNFLKACGALEGKGYRVSGLKGRRLIARVSIEEGKDYKDPESGETKEGRPQARITNERAA